MSKVYGIARNYQRLSKRGKASVPQNLLNDLIAAIHLTDRYNCDRRSKCLDYIYCDPNTEARWTDKGTIEIPGLNYEDVLKQEKDRYETDYLLREAEAKKVVGKADREYLLAEYAREKRYREAGLKGTLSAISVADFPNAHSPWSHITKKSLISDRPDDRLIAPDFMYGMMETALSIRSAHLFNPVRTTIIKGIVWSSNYRFTRSLVDELYDDYQEFYNRIGRDKRNDLDPYLQRNENAFEDYLQRKERVPEEEEF